MHALLKAAPIALALLASSCAAVPLKTEPYVTVYRDDSVSFQVRRDRIAALGGESYRLWLRWLWAKQRWSAGRVETALHTVSEVDCAAMRVRDLAVMKKDPHGQFFDVVERPPEEAPWRAFGAETGAAAAMRRLCEFVPELVRTGQGPGRNTRPD